MKKITFIDRLRYWFDNTMSKGPIALIAWLGILSFVFILVMTLVITLTGIANPPAPENPESPDVVVEPAPDFFEIAWRSLMRTLDAGTMGGDTGSPGYLLAMLIVTLGGVFIISILIGVLTSGIEAKLDDLRKGRSFVVEQNHTLILGWSPQVFTIISELVQANANQKNPCIVILADQDKVEMEDAIRSQIPNPGKTRVVCRTGSPLDLADLAIVNPHAARAIIIVAPEVDDPDTHVIKTLLALTNNPKRKKEKYHIVAEIRDPKNVAVAKMVGRDEAEIVLVGDLISRITVQTCRQSGLSIVYTELLNFGGDEIYFKAEPSLAGKQFGSALLAFEDSAVIGLFKDGKTLLNPPMDTRVAPGDQVIAISADDDTIKASGSTNLNIAADAIQPPGAPEGLPERTLILGWNKRGASIVRELDHYVTPESHTTIVAHGAADVPATENQQVSVRAGDTTDRQILDALDIPSFNHVIVLSYSDALGAQEADAQTLITLLHLRDLSEKTGKEFSIVSEMLDVRNRELAEVTRADDFIVSDHLVSLMLSQVAENKNLSAVFADLFDPAGSEIYLKPAENYVRAGTPVNFYTVVEAARRRGEVAFGYRLKRDARDAAKAYGVRVNPKKSQAITFEKGDKVIVVAES